jgi:hypothetical protein
MITNFLEDSKASAARPSESSRMKIMLEWREVVP